MNPSLPQGLVETVIAALAGVTPKIVPRIPDHPLVSGDTASPAARRIALAAQIIALRRPARRSRPRAIAPEAPPVLAVEPVQQADAVPAPPPRPARRVPRATFSALSLDDAAMLLAATAATHETPAPEPDAAATGGATTGGATERKPGRRNIPDMTALAALSSLQVPEDPD